MGGGVAFTGDFQYCAKPLGFVVLVRFEAQIGLSPLYSKREQL